MSPQDSQEPANNDVEKLFQEISPIIPKIVGQTCASLNHYPDQTEVDSFAQRIRFLLLDNDYRMLRSFRHESSPQTWLFKIARRRIRRWLRERDRMEGLDDIPRGSFIVQPDQEKWLLAKERDGILQEAKSKLTEHERKLFRLLFQEELTTAETAEILGIRQESVYKEKQRLIKKIQKIIEGKQK